MFLTALPVMRLWDLRAVFWKGVTTNGEASARSRPKTKVSYGKACFVCLTVMTKSTLTLTESGLLAVLLKQQRHAAIELARRRSQREHRRAAFWDTLTRPFRAYAARKLTNDSVRTVPRQV